MENSVVNTYDDRFFFLLNFSLFFFSNDGNLGRTTAPRPEYQKRASFLCLEMKTKAKGNTFPRVLHAGRSAWTLDWQSTLRRDPRASQSTQRGPQRNEASLVGRGRRPIFVSLSRESGTSQGQGPRKNSQGVQGTSALSKLEGRKENTEPKCPHQAVGNR